MLSAVTGYTNLRLVFEVCVFAGVVEVTALVRKSGNKNLCFADLDVNTADVSHRNEVACGCKLSFDLVSLIDNVNVAVALDDADVLQLFVNVFPIED